MKGRGEGGCLDLLEWQYVFCGFSEETWKGRNEVPQC